jgi:hypothetical protein
MKYKFGMIGCTYLMIIGSILYDILRFIFLTVIFIPIMFLPFNSFSRIMGNISKYVNER